MKEINALLVKAGEQTKYRNIDVESEKMLEKIEPAYLNAGDYMEKSK